MGNGNSGARMDMCTRGVSEGCRQWCQPPQMTHTRAGWHSSPWWVLHVAWRPQKQVAWRRCASSPGPRLCGMPGQAWPLTPMSLPMNLGSLFMSCLILSCDRLLMSMSPSPPVPPLDEDVDAPAHAGGRACHGPRGTYASRKRQRRQSCTSATPDTTSPRSTWAQEQAACRCVGWRSGCLTRPSSGCLCDGGGHAGCRCALPPATCFSCFPQWSCR